MTLNYNIIEVMAENKAGPNIDAINSYWKEVIREDGQPIRDSFKERVFGKAPDGRAIFDSDEPQEVTGRKLASNRPHNSTARRLPIPASDQGSMDEANKIASVRIKSKQ